MRARGILGSFFVTGRFLEDKKARGIIRSLHKQGHYIGPHSDAHLLYMPWEDRSRLLVTEDEFKDDLKANIVKLQRLGIARMDKFIAPYEWYNRQIVDWTSDLGLTLYNFTPGLRTAADYSFPEMGERYMDSKAISEQLFDFEVKQGLNGYIVLVHLGSDERRTDKFFYILDEIIDRLKDKNYKFVGLDEI